MFQTTKRKPKNHPPRAMLHSQKTVGKKRPKPISNSSEWQGVSDAKTDPVRGRAKVHWEKSVEGDFHDVFFEYPSMNMR